MNTEEVQNVMNAINRCWLEGHPEDMARYIHNDFVMLMPGFAGRIRGRDELIKSFVDYAAHAQTENFSEEGVAADIIGNSAVVEIRFRMIYALEGNRYESTGRDIWMFSRINDEWIATCRLMTDVVEKEI